MRRLCLAVLSVTCLLMTVAGCSSQPDVVVSRDLDGVISFGVCAEAVVDQVSFSDPSMDPGVGSVPTLWNLLAASAGEFRIVPPTPPSGFRELGPAVAIEQGQTLRVVLIFEEGEAFEYDLGRDFGAPTTWPSIQIERRVC